LTYLAYTKRAYTDTETDGRTDTAGTSVMSYASIRRAWIAAWFQFCQHLYTKYACTVYNIVDTMHKYLG